MSDPFETAFAAIQTSLGSGASATLAKDKQTITILSASGLDGQVVVDETGRNIDRRVVARYKKSGDFASPAKEGDLMTYTQDDGPASRVRVDGRVDIAGLVRLTLVSEYE
jgi:hypothetical protein